MARCPRSPAVPPPPAFGGEHGHASVVAGMVVPFEVSTCRRQRVEVELGTRASIRPRQSLAPFLRPRFPLPLVPASAPRQPRQPAALPAFAPCLHSPLAPVRGERVAVVIVARGRDSLEGQRTKNSKSFLVVKRKVIG